MYSPPFQGVSEVFVVLPNPESGSESERLKHFGGLLESNRAAIEMEIGAVFRIVNEPPEGKPCWLVGPCNSNASIKKLGLPGPTGPTIQFRKEQGLLLTDGRSAEEVMESFSYLRNLARDGVLEVEIKDCDTRGETITRIEEEVGSTFPSFGLKRKSWESICRRHMPVVATSEDELGSIQEWLAELEDAHTCIRQARQPGSFPYDFVELQGNLYFYRIPRYSVAWDLGVRPGDALTTTELDKCLRRTCATSHQKPYLAGMRLMETAEKNPVHFIAIPHSGEPIEWHEAALGSRWEHELVRWEILESKVAYLRVDAWLAGFNLTAQLDEAFKNIRSAAGLIVDLRSNPGGNVRIAEDFRSRFLDRERQLGTIRTTRPDGELGPIQPIMGEPSSKSTRWDKPTVFLTDPLTYSASEDALLGLRGQENIRIVGQRTGGGSGRVRTLRLQSGWRLHISTSLTYDYDGACVEGAGILPDKVLPFSFDQNAAILAAERLLS